MKTMNNQLDALAKRDNKIMTILKASEFSHIVANTNLGTLTLKLVYGGTGKDYVLVLDAVPFSKEDNEKVLAFLAPMLMQPLVSTDSFPVFSLGVATEGAAPDNIDVEVQKMIEDDNVGDDEDSLNLQNNLKNNG